MKRNILLSTLLLLALGYSTAWAQWGPAPDPFPGKSLKDAYKDYFMIGVAVNKFNVSVPEQAALVRQEFSSMTAENDMKPVSVHPAEGVWNWGAADSIANFARQHGIKLRGHCLCWHSQFSDWMFKDKKGRPVKKEVFYERLREHIHTVVNRYKDVGQAIPATPIARASTSSSAATSSLPRHSSLPMRPTPTPCCSTTTTTSASPTSVTVYIIW